MGKPQAAVVFIFGRTGNACVVQITVQVPLGVRLCLLDRWPVSSLVPESRAIAGHGGRGDSRESPKAEEEK